MNEERKLLPPDAKQIALSELPTILNTSKQPLGCGHPFDDLSIEMLSRAMDLSLLLWHDQGAWSTYDTVLPTPKQIRKQIERAVAAEGVSVKTIPTSPDTSIFIHPTQGVVGVCMMSYKRTLVEPSDYNYLHTVPAPLLHETLSIKAYAPNLILDHMQTVLET
ncbi:hypothetical protein ACLPJK_26475 [Pseudomonas aeruginosa]|uniref:hypothetical protein n=1 Tax=Pseudomonas aeruginosa TaxID=287 RepID=UPI003D28B67C